MRQSFACACHRKKKQGRMGPVMDVEVELMGAVVPRPSYPIVVGVDAFNGQTCVHTFS